MTPSASLFRLGELARFVVIVEDPAVVLIHDRYPVKVPGV